MLPFCKSSKSVILREITYFFGTKLLLPRNDNREVKFDAYGKRQTAKLKFLPSVFSSLYSRIKIIVFGVNSKRHFFFLYDLFKDNMKRIEKQR